ncbi:MAG: hypothetical protein LJE84_14105 [Gammaproteobacteria bacterium]|nr:hypothetical protein [Gammaproteobacteria bacterium]
MKDLFHDSGVADADSAEDAQRATAVLEARLMALREDIASLPAGFAPAAKAALQMEAAAICVDLEQGEAAWDDAREAASVYLEAEDWENVVLACDVLFQSDQDGSLAALGQGIWLAVTFPVSPERTVHMLQHVIDETPDDSDGAAVAAAAAQYVVDLRAEDEKQHNDLVFFTGQMLASVARRHSEVQTQEQFDFWFQKMELNDPAKFLPRLRNVVDVLVQDDWWFDREALQTRIPVN